MNLNSMVTPTTVQNINQNVNEVPNLGNNLNIHSTEPISNGTMPFVAPGIDTQPNINMNVSAVPNFGESQNIGQKQVMSNEVPNQSINTNQNLGTIPNARPEGILGGANINNTAMGGTVPNMNTVPNPNNQMPINNDNWQL